MVEHQQVVRHRVVFVGVEGAGGGLRVGGGSRGFLREGHRRGEEENGKQASKGHWSSSGVGPVQAAP